eukprot:3485068-Pyramimonas_sp.AAC.1
MPSEGRPPAAPPLPSPSGPQSDMFADWCDSLLNASKSTYSVDVDARLTVAFPSSSCLVAL